MSKRLKDAIDYSELYMKRKERLVDYKEGKLGEKTKAWLGFPSKIYQNWQAHWTLDEVHLGVLLPQDEPVAKPIPEIIEVKKEAD